MITFCVIYSLTIQSNNHFSHVAICFQGINTIRHLKIGGVDLPMGLCSVGSVSFLVLKGQPSPWMGAQSHGS